jgi:transcriptional regulator with XRE-family HTH domain
MGKVMNRDELPNFAENLRRLIFFEHRTGKEAAEALGVTEATISRWISGKRYPSAQALIEIDKRYGISPADLDADLPEFAQKLADADRLFRFIEEAHAARRKKETAQRERVVPIDKARKARKK